MNSLELIAWCSRGSGVVLVHNSGVNVLLTGTGGDSESCQLAPIQLVGKSLLLVNNRSAA